MAKKHMTNLKKGNHTSTLCAKVYLTFFLAVIDSISLCFFFLLFFIEQETEMYKHL